MKIAFVGRENKGSWQIRAVQMSLQLRKMGYTADCFDVRKVPAPKGYDRIIYVKRGTPDVWPDHCPVYWDAVDFWRQPHDEPLSREQAIELAKSRVPAHVTTIAATRRMAEDLGCRYVYHHHAPWLVAHPLRDKARVPVVVYEGHPRYLGKYQTGFERLCDFRLGRADDRCDALLAVRDAPFDGYMSRCWKSNVKAANALATGRVLICGPEAGCMETLPSECRLVIHAPEDIYWAIDSLRLNRVREAAYQASQVVAPRFSIQATAQRLLEILR